MSTFFFIFLLVIGFCVLMYMTLPKTDELREIHKDLPKIDDGFNSTKKIIGDNLNFCLALNEVEEKIYIALNENKFFREAYNYHHFRITRKEIDYNELTGIKIVEDDVTVSSINRGSQLTGALVGGVIAGGIGATVGGITGKTTGSKHIKNLMLRIEIKDSDRPYYDLPFFESKKPVEKKDRTLNRAYEDITSWSIILSNIIKENDKQVFLDVTNSISQEIEKLNELKNRNIISEEEFINLKAKLIK
ncbi:SHOCT domain-containing protein [Macrococcoides canis]|uniref:SHOCT domain-containing protein n=1 Tax=Macrococcoides canis TaxID=1855823 RepID=UPI00105E4BC3|nr:SHOCT domain-containing protein [Macrococcus canis]TDM24409.1 SHOCT domain-containing protein [Macrococcus canis]